MLIAGESKPLALVKPHTLLWAPWFRVKSLICSSTSDSCKELKESSERAPAEVSQHTGCFLQLGQPQDGGVLVYRTCHVLTVKPTMTESGEGSFLHMLTSRSESK